MNESAQSGEKRDKARTVGNGAESADTGADTARRRGKVHVEARFAD
jgi:hypothetical protein